MRRSYIEAIASCSFFGFVVERRVVAENVVGSSALMDDVHDDSTAPGKMS